MLIDDPNTVMTKSASVLEPVADEIPSTDDSELSADAVSEKAGPADMLRLARFEEACPSSVAISPLAWSTNTPVEKLNGPRLVEKEASELVTS
jgi:hypothetical protein